MTEASEETGRLPDWVKPGVRFKLDFGLSNRREIRGIVDDQAIVRTWLVHKKRWHYEALDDIWFAVNAQHIIDVRRSKS